MRACLFQPLSLPLSMGIRPADQANYLQHQLYSNIRCHPCFPRLIECWASSCGYSHLENTGEEKQVIKKLPAKQHDAAVPIQWAEEARFAVNDVLPPHFAR